MNKQELIKKYEDIFEKLYAFPVVTIGEVLGDLRQLDEPQPIKLKDVIARIKVFDFGTQKVWLDEILSELGSDYGTLKYKAGYEKGKFDGAIEREKVLVPQSVANYIEYTKVNEWDLLEAMDDIAYEDDKDLRKWFNNNTENFALAWINGYTVEEEKEKRYSVKIKGEIEENLLVYGLGINRYFFARTYDSSKRNEHTRKELEEAGFEEVFNSPLFEVEEVD